MPRDKKKSKRNEGFIGEGTPHKVKFPRAHIAQELRENGQADVAEAITANLMPWAQAAAQGRQL